MKNIKTLENYIQSLKKKSGEESISKCLDILGIKSLEENMPEKQKELLKEAYEVSQKGQCIDQALFVISCLKKGFSPEQIEEKINQNEEIMYFFHGLIQGPCQKKLGSDKTMEYIFKEYSVAYSNEEINVDLSSETSKDKFISFLKKQSENSVFALSLSKTGLNTHVLSIQVKSNSLLVWDEDEFLPVMAIDDISSGLEEYYDEGYLSAKLYSTKNLSSKKNMTSQFDLKKESDGINLSSDSLKKDKKFDI